MAQTLKWVAPEAQATALTTELNSLADGSLSAASAAVNNDADLYEYIIFEVALASFTSVGTPFVGVYIFYSHDGTNYEDVSTAASHALVASLPVTTGASAKRAVSRAALLLPLKFKLALQNKAGAALAASGSTLKYRRMYEQSV